MDPSKTHNLKSKVLSPYCCGRCLKKFSTFEQCRKHKRRHDITRFHTGFNKRSELVSIMEKKATTYEDENQVYKCDQCDLQFLSKFGLTGHQACHAISPMIGSPRYIVKIFHNVQEGLSQTPHPVLYTCRYCPKTFPKLFVKEAHERDHFRQSFSKSYKCRYCSQSFTSRDVCSVHQSTHLEGSLFQCKSCTFTSLSQKKLLNHKRKHGKRFLKCIRCELEFKSKKKLIKHVKKVHRNRNSRKRKLFVDESVERKKCKLPVEEHLERKKQKIFAEESVEKEKNKHLVEGRETVPRYENFASDDEQKESKYPEDGFYNEEVLSEKVTFPNVKWKSLDGETLYGCVLCGKTFTKEADLNTHKKMHAKQADCDSTNDRSSEVNNCDSRVYISGEKKYEYDSVAAMESRKSRSDRNSLLDSHDKHEKGSNDMKYNTEMSLLNCENDLDVSVGSKVTCTVRRWSDACDPDAVDSVEVSEIGHDNDKEGHVGGEKIAVESNHDASTKTSLKRKRSEVSDSELVDSVDESVLDVENENIHHRCDFCTKLFSDESKLTLHKKSAHLKQPKLSKFFKQTCTRNSTKKTSPKSCAKTSSKAVPNNRNVIKSFGNDSNSAGGVVENSEVMSSSVNNVKDSSCNEQKVTCIDTKCSPSIKCFLCEKSFGNKKTLDSHMDTHMSWSDISEALEHNQTSTCHLCGKTYSSSATLAMHLRTHVKRPKSNRIKENMRRKSAEEYSGSGVDFKDKVYSPSEEIKARNKKNYMLSSDKTLYERSKEVKSNKTLVVKGSLSDITNSKLKHDGNVDRVTFKCRHCNEMFPSQTALNNHLREHKTDSSKTRLEHGSCSFKPSRKTVQVRLMDIVNNSQNRADNEDLNHSDVDNDDIHLRCGQCNAVFFSRVTLECHTRIHNERADKHNDHQNAQLLRNSTQANLLDTDKTNNDDCKYLDTENTDVDKNDLKEVSSGLYGRPVDHEQGNLNDVNKNEKIQNDRFNLSPPEDCQKCMLSFRSATALEGHIMYFKQSGETRCKRFQCQSCDMCFVFKCHLDKHTCFEIPKYKQKVNKMKKEPTKTSQKKQHTCEKCGKRYNRKGDFTRHLKIHTGVKPYACEHCDLRFFRKSSLKRHENIHSWNKTYLCRYCDEKFPTVDRRAYHEKKHKSITNEFRCEKCNQSFPFLASLTYHKEKVHASSKKYKCRFCQKCFAQSGDLKVHERVHTGEKPYRCSHSDCKKAFVSKIHLSRHETRRHSLEEREKPFQCDYCDKRYFEKRNLEDHVRQKHTKSKFKFVVKMADDNETTSSLESSSSESESESSSSDSESGSLPSDLESISSELSDSSESSS